MSRLEAGYVLAHHGLRLDDENFVNGAGGFRMWTGLGSWQDRTENCLRTFAQFREAKGEKA